MEWAIGNNDKTMTYLLTNVLILTALNINC